jgi:hypothetical protein
MGRRGWFQRYGYRTQAVRCEDQDLLLRAYRESRFACLPEVLLGYRHGRVALRNTLLGRWHYARSLWEVGFKAREPLLALRGGANQFARAAAAAGAVCLGLRGRLLRRRFLPATEKQIADWNEYWKQIVLSAG